MEDNRIQMANSRLKGTMAEFERGQVEFAMVQAKFQDQWLIWTILKLVFLSFVFKMR